MRLLDLAYYAEISRTDFDLEIVIENGTIAYLINGGQVAEGG
jgi:hypothetical protein